MREGEQVTYLRLAPCSLLLIPSQEHRAPVPRNLPSSILAT